MSQAQHANPLPNPVNPAASARPTATIIRWASVGLIVLSVFLLMRLLPIGPAIEAASGWIESLGVWGPVVFGLIYVAATILLLPGSVLTLTAGLLFGLVWGTITVSIASVTGAGAALLIARYLARQRVARLAQHSPKFAAMDRAVSQGGWKIVAMLRLSPVVPFNLQNYFYGLTGIGFWTCILTSWIAMLPGTFMFVYIGYLGREGVQAAAADAGSGASLGVWVLRIVGFLATVAVSVYITRIARRALKEQSDVEDQPTAAAASATTTNQPTEPATGNSPMKTTILAIVAVALFSSSVYAQFHRGTITNAFAGLFGPPPVASVEQYADEPSTATFDHSTFDAVLAKVVTEDGWVDYEKLRSDTSGLDAYIASLAEAPFDQLGRDEKLAILINAYNAFTLQLILDHWPVDSIKDIPSSKRWDAKRWNLGGKTLSLNQIEHEYLRAHFVEPRIHFAINCASVGCPPLYRHAFVASQIDEQLDAATRTVHRNGSRWFKFDRQSGKLQLTAIYKWFGGDFKKVAGSVQAFAARYDSNLKAAMDAGERIKVSYMDYDWSLNRPQ